MAGYGVAEETPAQDMELLARLPEPIVAALDEECTPTPEQVEQYAKDGHIIMRSILPPPLLEVLREAIAEHTYRRNPRTTPLAERNTYDRAFIQVGGMWAHGGLARAFTFSKRLASCAARLMGSAGALLHHDQALFKEAEGGFTPWHCAPPPLFPRSLAARLPPSARRSRESDAALAAPGDQQYWPLETNSSPTISAWIPLCDCPLPMGPLMFASGSHRWPSARDGTGLHDIRISDESESEIWRHVHESGCEVACDGLRLGDV